jgi:multidrug transporter EmrE-like cation transporter
MSGLQLAALLVVYAVVGTVGLIMMKRGLPADLSIFPLSFESVLRFSQRCMNLLVIVGFICYAGSFALSLVILAVRPLSFAYPLMGAVAYVAALVAAIVVLGERVTLVGAIGVVLIGVGIVLVARTP